MATRPDTVSTVQLTPAAISDITELLNNRDHILKVVEALSAEKPTTSIPALAARIAPRLNIKPEVATKVAFGLWNLKTLQRRFDLDEGSLVAAVTRSLASQTGDDWKQAYSNLWIQTLDDLEAALRLVTDDHPIMITAKASSLAYAQLNLFTGARLITEIRPVFDSAGDRIVKTLIMHSLVIQFVDSAQNRNTAIYSLDSDDVGLLRRQCERAEKKMKVASATLVNLEPVVLPERQNP